MVVTCPDCGKVYDDARRWTICPHQSLGDNPRKMEPQTMPDRHPAVAFVLQFFAYSHLPPHLQEISKPFGELAEKIADGPQNSESTVALRKLLEAKDAAVRAVVAK